MNFSKFALPTSCMLALSFSASAQQGSNDLGGPPAMTTSELTFMLQQQEKRFESRFEKQAAALAEQRALIDAQANTIQQLEQRLGGADGDAQVQSLESLQARIEKLEAAPRTQPGTAAGQSDQLAQQQEAIATQTAAIQALQAQFDQFSSEQQQVLSEADQRIRARLESLEGNITKLQSDETTSTYDQSEFPGAFQVPGLSAAIRFGGFAKAAVVQNLDGFVGEENRFIVGSIPTRGEQSGDEEANLNVRQSRINLEYRQETPKGQLRAYIEGDFAGGDESTNTFRLRHAFGQFQDILAGQYHTNFMDIEASPEEIDFEGVNGRVNVRQTQLRYFPEFGNGWNLILSAEDTDPDVTGGDGLSTYPDLIASIRRRVRDTWNMKVSAMLRSIEARWDQDEEIKQDEIAWGFSVSGRRTVPLWDPRDNVNVQFTFGEGVGRYINDLSTVGGQDAVFDEADGDMELLPVFAGFVSFQKWWRDGLRSTAILGYVDVDNADFQPDDAYDKTWRFSTNLIWSPVPSIDLGGELLLGERQDKDGSSGNATQLQFAARYRF
jgi:archaellum component FlaC